MVYFAPTGYRVSKGQLIRVEGVLQGVERTLLNMPGQPREKKGEVSYLLCYGTQQRLGDSLAGRETFLHILVQKPPSGPD